jgi:hypothetical protein
MKTRRKSIGLFLALVGAPVIAAINSSCMGPAGRSQVRQETRVQNRTTNRQNNRRGW